MKCLIFISQYLKRFQLDRNRTLSEKMKFLTFTLSAETQLLLKNFYHPRKQSKTFNLLYHKCPQAKNIQFSVTGNVQKVAPATCWLVGVEDFLGSTTYYCFPSSKASWLGNQKLILRSSCNLGIFTDVLVLFFWGGVGGVRRGPA